MSRFSVERQRAAVEHVAVEQVRFARRPPPLGLLDERHHERVQLVRLAMVRVERHVDRIPRRRAVDVFGNRDGAERHVLHRGARRERAAAGRYLDDPVALAVGQSFQHGVCRGERRHVDGWIGEPSLPRAIEHLAVLRIVGDRHRDLLLRSRTHVCREVHRPEHLRRVRGTLPADATLTRLLPRKSCSSRMDACARRGRSLARHASTACRALATEVRRWSRSRGRHEDWRRRLRHGRLDLGLRARHERRGPGDRAGGLNRGARRGRGQRHLPRGPVRASADGACGRLCRPRRGARRGHRRRRGAEAGRDAPATAAAQRRRVPADRAVGAPRTRPTRCCSSSPIRWTS